MVVRLSTKGQIVIPKEMRDRLGLEPGAEFTVSLEEDRIVLELQDRRTLLQSLHGNFEGLYGRRQQNAASDILC